MRSTLFRLFSALILLSGCSESDNSETIAADSTLVGDTLTSDDSIAENKSDTISNSLIVNRSDWTPDDYIIECPDNQKSELRNFIRETITMWKDAPNPIVATYEGNDFGDYFHIIFKDAKGTTYDFGKGDNAFGEYPLFASSGQYEDNPEFLHKKFEVYWDWKESEFPCCDGEYAKAKAYLPSITGLKLISR